MLFPLVTKVIVTQIKDQLPLVVPSVVASNPSGISSILSGYSELCNKCFGNQPRCHGNKARPLNEQEFSRSRPASLLTPSPTPSPANQRNELAVCLLNVPLKRDAATGHQVASRGWISSLVLASVGHMTCAAPCFLPVGTTRPAFWDRNSQISCSNDGSFLCRVAPFRAQCKFSIDSFAFLLFFLLV